MKPHAVLCFALLALFLLQAATASDDHLDLSLQSNEATAAAAEGIAVATTTVSSGVAILPAPQLSMDVDITTTQQPLLTATEVPCEKKCKEKCTTVKEKHCQIVQVPKKHCVTTQKTYTKQHCKKKCTTVVPISPPDVLQPSPEDNPNPVTPPTDNPNPSAPPAVNPNPSAPPAVNPNPSAPPAVNPNPSAPPAVNPNPSAPPAFNPNPSAPPAVNANPSAPPTVYPNPAAATSRTLLGKKHEKDFKAKLTCQKVCIDVPLIKPETECFESTVPVEKCNMVPEKKCEEECVCIPQKALKLKLPKKPEVKLSISKHTDKFEESSKSSKRDLKELPKVDVILPNMQKPVDNVNVDLSNKDAPKVKVIKDVGMFPKMDVILPPMKDQSKVSVDLTKKEGDVDRVTKTKSPGLFPSMSILFPLKEQKVYTMDLNVKSGAEPVLTKAPGLFPSMKIVLPKKPDTIDKKITIDLSGKNMGAASKA